MSTDYWIRGAFDRALTTDEQAAVSAYLELAFEARSGDFGVDAYGFYIDDDSSALRARRAARQLPPDVTVTLSIECSENDTEKDIEYLGPKALQLEVEELNRQIDAMTLKRNQLMLRVDA